MLGPSVELINRLITIALCTLATVGAIKEGITSMRLGGSTNILKIPKYPFMWITAIGFFTVVVAVVVFILYNRYKKTHPRTHPTEKSKIQKTFNAIICLRR
jgi:hypothetical protein